jgi:hypothetical protein
MSRLSVYWPDETERANPQAARRAVLPFPSRTDKRTASLNVIERARVLFNNRRCRHCAYPVVEPLELDDALTNSSGLEIPGSATLVGFRCQSCDCEWYL